MLVWSLVNRKLIGHHHHRLCIAKRYHQSETIDKALQGAHMHGKYAHLHLWPKTSILKSFISLLIFTSYLFGVKFSILQFCSLLIFYTYNFFECILHDIWNGINGYNSYGNLLSNEFTTVTIETIKVNDSSYSKTIGFVKKIIFS